MPAIDFLNCCERFFSVVASLLSIATFIAVIQVKSKVREYHKADKFHTQRQSILNQLMMNIPARRLQIIFAATYIIMDLKLVMHIHAEKEIFIIWNLFQNRKFN